MNFFSNFSNPIFSNMTWVESPTQALWYLMMRSKINLDIFSQNYEALKNIFLKIKCEEYEDLIYLLLVDQKRSKIWVELYDLDQKNKLVKSHSLTYLRRTRLRYLLERWTEPIRTKVGRFELRDRSVPTLGFRWCRHHSGEHSECWSSRSSSRIYEFRVWLFD